MHLSQLIPWLGNPPDALHRKAAASIIDLWTHDGELGDSLAGMAWAIDGVTEDEAEAVSFLLELALREPRLAALILELPWVAAMPVDAPRDIPWGLFNLLYSVGVDNPDLGTLLASHPLIADDVTNEEASVMELLAEVGFRDLEWAKRLAGADWVLDGMEWHEFRLLASVVATREPSPSLSEYLLGLPRFTDGISGDLRPYVLMALSGLALNHPDSLREVTARNWYVDGLGEDEAALIVILSRAVRDSPELFRDLLSAHFVQAGAVDLPLAGPVRLWAVQNTPFPEGEGLLQRMEEAVRYWEEFVEEPFPTNAVILSVVDPRGKSYGLNRGGHLGTHMRLIRSVDLGTVSDVPHETGHYFFTHPRWLGEGVSQFGQAHLRHLDGLQTLEDRQEELALTTGCARYANIRHFQYVSAEENLLTFDVCPYDLGENFILSLFSLIGREAMFGGLGELYRLDWDGGQPITEELVFEVLLRNTPVEKVEEFRDLYRRLHGGSSAFPEADFDDDHGDDAGSASMAVVGRSIAGGLDYPFDFDYFRFEAQGSRNYRIIVEHPSLPPEWIAIYAPDGVSPDAGGLKSRSATPFGPELLWTATATGDYFVAVRNFGGLTGSYNLNIASVEDGQDDHGDAAASATSLTLGQTVTGTVDDGFDFDYFRFQVEQGQRVRVMVRGETLESLTVALYEADGATPALMRREDVDAIVSGGGEFVDIIDLRNVSWPQSVSFDWIAPRTGEFLLAVSNIEGLVGSYVATVTAIER